MAFKQHPAGLYFVEDSYDLCSGYMGSPLISRGAKVLLKDRQG